MKQDRTVSTVRRPAVCGLTSKKQVHRRPGRLIVEFFGGLGPMTRHLDMVTAGEMVTGIGTVTAVNLLGSAEAPRAIVTVRGTDGESAQCVVDTDHYLELFGYLVENTQVQLRGSVRRPLPDMPALIDVMTIRPAQSVVAVQVEAVSA